MLSHSVVSDLCDPVNCSPPGSSDQGISQARILAAAAKSLQSCSTLCDPIDGNPPDPAVPGILQARTLEWVAISSSNAWKWKVKVKSLSRVQLLPTTWTAAYQAPPSMGFSRQEYWSGVPLPSPKNTGVGCNFLLQHDTLHLSIYRIFLNNILKNSWFTMLYVCTYIQKYSAKWIFPGFK